jgi:uncharacterized membrane protein
LRIFPWQKKIEFFNPEERLAITTAIKLAEEKTSGEVRVFVESRCRYVDAIDRAVEIFYALKMEKTDNRNAVLIYVALKDHQLAVYGDEGIHAKLGQEYWNSIVMDLVRNFNRDDYAIGLSQSVNKIGEALHYHFPYDRSTDKNELPDDIVFGH